MTRKPRQQLNHGSQKRGWNEGERTDGGGGGVQRQKLQEDKNSFSKSREQRVRSEKVHASVKTRLKGNRRLSAGQSGRPKPERETSGGGGTSQGRGPINPGPPPMGGQLYLVCGRRVLQHLSVASDIPKGPMCRTNASHPPRNHPFIYLPTGTSPRNTEVIESIPRPNTPRTNMEGSRQQRAPNTPRPE